MRNYCKITKYVSCVMKKDDYFICVDVSLYDNDGADHS